MVTSSTRGCSRPGGQQLAEQPGGGGLADRHRAGDADHERRPGRGQLEEAVGRRRAARRCADVAAEQPGQRQVDLADVGQAGRDRRARGAAPGWPRPASSGRWRPARPSRPGAARAYGPATCPSWPAVTAVTLSVHPCAAALSTTTGESSAPRRPRLSRTRIGRRRARTVFAMCGIVGYAGPQVGGRRRGRGLRRLEYRGYDSAGVGRRDRRMSSDVAKRAGKLGNLEKVLSDNPLPGDRPRPSGTPAGPPTARPTDVNAHPHTSGERAGRAGPQRDHRELRRCSAPSSPRPGSPRSPRPTPRSSPSCSVSRSTTGAGLTEAHAQRSAAGSGRLHPGRGGRPAARHGGGRPPQLAPGGRGRRGRELRRLRRRRLHRAHPRGDRARPGPGRDDHAERPSR